jgi:hypothetical protein
MGNETVQLPGLLLFLSLLSPFLPPPFRDGFRDGAARGGGPGPLSLVSLCPSRFLSSALSGLCHMQAAVQPPWPFCPALSSGAFLRAAALRLCLPPPASRLPLRSPTLFSLFIAFRVL